MKPQFEPPRPFNRTTSFVAYERIDARFDFHWHYHPEFELTYIERSRGERLVGDHVERYGPGDLVLLGANLPHSWTSDRTPAGDASEHRAVVVQFRAEVIPPNLRALVEFRSLEDLFLRAARGLHFRGVIVPSIASRLRRLLELDGLAAWLELLGILADLAAHPRGRPLASLRFRPDLPLTQQARLQQALRYIDEHNDPELSLESTAQAAGVSASTLARLFRRLLGRSFVSYVNDLRIALVCRELIASPRGVAELAYASGFNNLANFNRCFRAMKRMSPTEFRARYAATRVGQVN